MSGGLGKFSNSELTRKQYQETSPNQESTKTRDKTWQARKMRTTVTGKTLREEK